METELTRCLPFINSQIQPTKAGKSKGESRPPWRTVTISRQTGSGGHIVAEKLGEFLQEHAPTPNPWTVFDRDLVEKVLKEHKLPSWMERFMPEDRIKLVEGMVEELFGLHPPAWTLIHKTAETILHLAEIGNVILIGRGGNVVTSHLEHVFHVRLVAPMDKRIERIQETERLSKKAALAFIRKEDLGRQRYLKRYLDKNIDDPLLYHLTINTARTGYDTAAALIGKAMLMGNQD